jgi:UDP-glucose 4-epimerase
MRPSSLVTGGAGFIGSHVARHCLDLGHSVTVLDDLSGGYRDHVPAGAHYIEASIEDEKFVNRLFEEHRFDYVYHLAAYAAEGLSHFIRRFNYLTNLVGSMNLINASVNFGVKCFVFTSSIAVYGKNQLPMRENLSPLPEDPYGISKYAVELDLRAAHEMFGLPFIVFRPHNVYGENQNLADPYRNVIGIFMNRLMMNQPLPIFGDGEQTRAFSYVGDVAHLIARSVDIREARNSVFNVGADVPYTINQLAAVVSEAFSVPVAVEYLAPRNEVLHAYADHSRAKAILGAGPQVGLEEGIARMAAWARKTGARRGVRFEEIEIEKNLPASWAELSSVSSK